ncbi:MAG: DUF4382 domain-containing protein, partial [Gammaproteobacteria bacterium]|nr:DUF4382 domain-containing protein [Gammaproteobacteria bacterium]
LNILEAVLIGGQGADGQQILFQGEEPIDLLALTNFSEAIIFGEVEPGTYSKLRLVIDSLELVPADGGPSQYPALPANGKIDLLDQDGFEVLPGTTLLVEIDMDANKSLKITGAGNSGRYKFRPVVKVQFMTGDLDELKLARLEGTVAEISTASPGSFVLCDIETPDSCVNVATDSSTSIFGADGMPTDFATLMPNDIAVAIGTYSLDGGIVLNASVLEIGGNAEQVQGTVVSNPADDAFIIYADGSDLTVQLQARTRYYDANGEIGPESVIIGAEVEVEGVVDATDSGLIRAALVFVEAAEDAQLSGTIAEPLDSVMRTFNLTLADSSTVCVDVVEEAKILLVDAAAGTATMATIDELSVGQIVDLFGAMNECFDAHEVIVDVNASPAP